MKLRRVDLLLSLGLAVVVFFIWCVCRDRLSVDSWKVPCGYDSDAAQMLGWIKAASELDYYPFLSKTVSRLNAPFGANWNDYPMYEEIYLFFLGVVAKFIGLYAASSFGQAFAHVLSAVSFYLCCRLLRCRKVWAFVGAILFAYTFYNLHRQLGHLVLALSYTLPFAMLSCWLVSASKRMRLGDRMSWVCLGAAFVMGLSSPYNLNVYLQLMCFALAACYFTTRRKENLRIGALCLLASVIGFVSINLDTLGYQWVHGKNPEALVRNYFESELYALKPIEFIIPPPSHHSGTLAQIGNKYLLSAWVRGEIFSPYLGVIGIIGLGWIFAEALLKILRRSRTRLPAYGPQILWVIFYSVIGGVNCVISLGGIRLFRASNRYSIFVSTIIMIFLVMRLSRLSLRWKPAASLAVGAFALGIGLFDQLPKPPTKEETEAIRKTIAMDEAFAQSMEAALPPKAMVFQLPVQGFPEATPIHEMIGYELLRPYFATRSLRFSHGSNRGRAREAWQKDVEKMPPLQLVQFLEQHGFAALYINRKGFPDRGAALVQQVAAVSGGKVIEDELKEQVCVFLKPSSAPEALNPDARADFVFAKGWVDARFSGGENQRWAAGNASLTYFNPFKGTMTYSLKLQIASPTIRTAKITHNGVDIFNGVLNSGQGQLIQVDVVARPGNNSLQFSTDGKPVRLTKDMPLFGSFMVSQVEFIKK